MLTGVRVDTLIIADSRPLEWPLLDVDDQPLDVRTWAALAQVRAYPGGPLLHEWSSTATPKSITLGIGELALIGHDPAAWPWRVGDYDILLRAPGQTVPTRLARGRVRVTPRISNG